MRRCGERTTTGLQRGSGGSIYETGIGVEEIELALKGTKSGKAIGPSEVSVDMVKCMGRESLAQVARYFNICRQTKAVPDSTNGALLRLLPKIFSL